MNLYNVTHFEPNKYFILKVNPHKRVLSIGYNLTNFNSTRRIYVEIPSSYLILTKRGPYIYKLFGELEIIEDDLFIKGTPLEPEIFINCGCWIDNNKLDKMINNKNNIDKLSKYLFNSYFSSHFGHYNTDVEFNKFNMSNIIPFVTALNFNNKDIKNIISKL